MMKSHGNTFSYPFISQMKISEDQRNYHTTQQSASQEVVYGAGLNSGDKRAIPKIYSTSKNNQISGKETQTSRDTLCGLSVS